jgi:hypothetical protein
MVQMLIAALALVAGAVVGPLPQFSPVQLDRPAHLALSADVGDGALSAAVLTPARGQRAQTPGFGSVPGTGPDLLLSSVLLASLLLALIRVPSVPSQAARALPQRRGPPVLAFTD